MMRYILFCLVWFTVALHPYASRAQEANLDYYLNEARMRSPLLADFRNQIESGKVDSQLIRASYAVQVNGISNNYYAPNVRGFGYDNVITNGGQLSAQVQAQKTFVSRGNLENQYRAVRLATEGVGNTAAIADRDLKKTITTQYITTYGDMMVYQYDQEILAVYQNEEKILKSLTQSNVYKQADYLTFYVSLQQQQLLTSQAAIQLKNDFATLNYMAGIVDTSQRTLQVPPVSTAPLPPVTSSIFYQQYTLDSLKLLNDQEAIAYSYKPKVNAVLDAGYNSSLMYDAYKNFGTGIGLTLAVPIYDGHQRKLKMDKIHIAERTRQQYRSFFLQQYAQQIAQLNQQLYETKALLNDINGQIKYSRTLIDVNQRLLGSGEIRVTDLILSINGYLNARNLLNQNGIAQMQIINQINYWQNP